MAYVRNEVILNEQLFLKNIDDLWLGISPKMQSLGIKHAFTTRLAGKSDILENSDLNMSYNVNDKEEFISYNRQKVCKALQMDFNNLTAVQQVHGDKIVCLDESLVSKGKDSYKSAIEGTDALITNIPNVPLMLLFADCVPMIVADPIKKVIAVVHGGWRGTVAGIVAKTVQKMVDSYFVQAKDCIAVIGPSIGPCCFQVGDEVYQEAKNSLTNYQEIFTKDKKEVDKWYFDLWQTNYQQLIDCGLEQENVVKSAVCTLCNHRLFFSHRFGSRGRFAAIASL